MMSEYNYNGKISLTNCWAYLSRRVKKKGKTFTIFLNQYIDIPINTNIFSKPGRSIAKASGKDLLQVSELVIISLPLKR